MRFIFFTIILIFTISNHASSINLNDTFRVDKQSYGYRLGWDLAWAEGCMQFGYFNKFWKLYKKALATNNPMFKGIKKGWSSMSTAVSIECSESSLKRIINDTEKTLENLDSENSLNNKDKNIANLYNKDGYNFKIGWSDKHLCSMAISGKDKSWEQNPKFYPIVNEAKRRGLDCGVKEEKQNSNNSSKIYSSSFNEIKKNSSDFLVCQRFGKYKGEYMKEAEKRGLNCNSDEGKKDYKLNSINSKTKGAEGKCTEIGFKKGTEKYGDCVLKMIELK